MRTMLDVGRVVLNDEIAHDVAVLVEDGVIAAIDRKGNLQGSVDTVLREPTMTLIPGLIDIHVHGGLGHSFSDDSASLEALAREVPRWGVTSVLPTLSAMAHDELIGAIDRIGKHISAAGSGTRFVGIHLEGPYLNPNRKGAQDPAAIRDPDPSETDELVEAGSGSIRLMALAPEMSGATAVLERLHAAGVRSSVGHSEATLDTIRSAVSLGLRQATHTFNGMQGLHHRSTGTVGAVLYLDDIDCEIIADGIHVAPEVLSIAWRAKGTSRTILVSDATRIAGMPDGKYHDGHRIVTVGGRRATLSDGTLAGSCSPLSVGVQTMVTECRVPLPEAVRMASLNPAKILEIDDTLGSIEVGKQADLVLLDHNLNPRLTMIAGVVEYDGR